MDFFNFYKNKRKEETIPDFWKEYLSSFEHMPSKKDSIEKIRFVCFDTETTGLQISSDQILSIGAVGIENWTIDISESFECILDQEYEATEENISIHGLLPKLRNHSISETMALKSFLAYIKNSVLVGHHVAFDIGMINKSLYGMTGQKLKLRNQAIDTLNLAKRLFPLGYHFRAEELSLDQLAKENKISLSGRHTASGDAYITAILFLKLLSKLQKRGNYTLGSLLRTKF